MKKIYLVPVILSMAISFKTPVDGQIKNAVPVKDTIHVIGHAHMDMNWLWTYSETMQMCKRV